MLVKVADESPEVVDQKAGMRLARWAEVGIHPEMNLELTELEPASTTPGDVTWFGYFRDAKRTFVELSRKRFTARRHRKLHMVDSAYLHGDRP